MCFIQLRVIVDGLFLRVVFFFELGFITVPYELNIVIVHLQSASLNMIIGTCFIRILAT